MFWDPDPYVFGPPGSGSVIICMDPDPDPSIKQKYEEQPFISTVFRLLYVLVSLKNKINKQTIENKNYFLSAS